MNHTPVAIQFKRKEKRHSVWRLSLFTMAILLIASAGALWYWQERNVDLLIVNGLIVDGTGSEPYMADIAIRQGKIIGVSRWRYILTHPRKRIDAGGRVVAPGFIDAHTHIEANLPQSAVFEPSNFLKQGVTTLITGNCGRSLTDIGQMFRDLERHSTRINVATFIGHNSVRRIVMKDAARAPSPDELKRMGALVGRAIDEGALGLSTGLAYSPGRFAPMNELVYLAIAASDRGGMYASHIRNEAHDGDVAVREAIKIGQAAGAITQISHIKCSGRAMWYSMAKRLRLLDQAREAGLQIYADAYPYDRSSTTTDILLPDWALADERAALRRAAKNQQVRRNLREAILAKLNLDGWQDLTHVRLVAGKADWIGRTLAEVPLPAPSLSQQVENLIDISIRGGAQAIYADMNERDVRLALANSYTVFGSDSAVRDTESNYKPHPRGSGTFPRIFRRYVYETGELKLAEAVRKASGLAADIFGLQDRGYLQTGKWADVVVFDLERIEDRADYDQPFAEPVGIQWVIVNGVITVENGSLTEELPSGQALRNSRRKEAPAAD
jgi:N-acyl-D-amino-acid deacylase